MKRFWIVSLIFTIAASLSAQTPLKITFLVRGSDTNGSSAEKNPVLAELDRLSGTQIEFLWKPDPAFSDELALAVANNSLPMVVATDKNALFLKAVKEGKFWDIGPYLNDYPNLAKINPIILDNTKVDGVLYALPKTRPLGRNGMVFRQDWLDKLKLPLPKTLLDFEKMLQAFTERDPDGNRQADTWGLTLTTYRGSFDEIAVWFGAPNGWGRDSQGRLTPAFLTEEYNTFLHALKSWYDKGWINRNFAIFDPAGWNKTVGLGQAGVIVDITGRGPGIIREATAVKKTITMNIQGAVEGPAGYRVMATDGFAGVIAFSKVGIPDVETLKKVLAFIDVLNSDQGRDLMLLGRAEVDWKKTETGAKRTPYEGQVLAGPDMAQVLVFPSAPSATVAVKSTPGSVIRLEAEVQADNEKHLVTNPAVGLTSAMQARRGAYLQDLIDDARVRYIMGLVDDTGYQALVEHWRQVGGDQLIQEINEADQRLVR